ncbi:MAG: primosomal protein N', partial [Pseudomonadota bacterium]
QTMDTQPLKPNATWQVAVNAPLMDTFTYRASEDLDISPGVSVRVPFGPKNREISGLIIEPDPSEGKPKFEPKDILGVDPERPQLTPEQLQWMQWISRYYIYPMGQVQQLAFPPLKKNTNRKSRKSPIVPEVSTIDPPQLTKEQEDVLSQIDIETFSTYLLHGVTGSGKTEVYIEVIEKVIQQGRTAIVLVPEISLTPQLIRRFAERFPNEIGVIHSHLTDREKTNQWWEVVDGKKRLLIGARSALFCPIPNLGVIIVDEEHEASFKQDEKLKYNARDMAVVKGRIENCPVILGSATPSLETWHNATSGKYQLLSMKNRVSDRPLPTVEIVDLRTEKDTLLDLPHWLSPNLYEKLKMNFENGHQSALFLNRRGVAPSVQCYSCGHIYMCPNCDISLTLHGKNHLVCHYCNYHETMDSECPACGEGEPKAYGLGTEAVEQSLQTLFPNASIFRADRDELVGRESIEDMVSKMENNEIDFLVGTQMIAKGLDFKNLTLVGIVLADIAFNVPDFRASERSFQLCTQVSGRAGRHEVPGQVVIQTYCKDHPSLVAAKNHDYEYFANNELKQRSMFQYPPFGKIAAVRMSAMRESELIEESQQLTHFLKSLIEKFPNLKGSQVLGPTPAPLSRIKNRYRYHILLKADQPDVLNYICQKAQEFIKENVKKSKSLIDVDPYSLI